MIFSYYYLDMLLLVRDFFLISVILIALCLYTFLEKKLATVNYKISLFYSVTLYFLFVLNIYLVSAFSQIQTYYYLFNYSLSMSSFLFQGDLTTIVASFAGKLFSYKFSMAISS